MKFQMIASECASFVHHLPFVLVKIMSADKLRNLENDDYWQFLLTTIRFLDMSYLPSYTTDSLNVFR